MTEEDRHRSVSRARRQMRHKLVMMDADRMFTFTRRGGFETREVALGVFDKWYRRYSKVSGSFQAVVVLEEHLGGGENHGRFHLHVALNRFHPLKVMLYHWHRALGAKTLMRLEESPGGIDAGKADRRKKGPRAIYRYMAKYLAKGWETQPKGTKRYTSRGKIDPPETTVYYLPAGPAGFYQAVRFARAVVGQKFLSHGHFRSPDGEEWVFFSTW